MSVLRLSSGESVLHFCKRNSLCYNNVWRRIEKGLQVDEAAEEALKNKGNKHSNRKHFYKGKWIGEYFPRGENIYERVIHKIKKGMTVDEAMETELKGLL